MVFDSSRTRWCTSIRWLPAPRCSGWRGKPLLTYRIGYPPQTENTSDSKPKKRSSFWYDPLAGSGLSTPCRESAQNASRCHMSTAKRPDAKTRGGGVPPPGGFRLNKNTLNIYKNIDVSYFSNPPASGRASRSHLARPPPPNPSPYPSPVTSAAFGHQTPPLTPPLAPT